MFWVINRRRLMAAEVETTPVYINPTVCKWFSLLHIQLIPPSHTRNDFCDLSPFRHFKTHDKIFVGFNIVCRGPLKVIIYTNSHLLIVAMSHLRTFCHQIHHPAKINNPNPSLQAFSTHSDSVQNGFFTFLLVRHKKRSKRHRWGLGSKVIIGTDTLSLERKVFLWSVKKVMKTFDQCQRFALKEECPGTEWLGRSCLVWFWSQLHWY